MPCRWVGDLLDTLLGPEGSAVDVLPLMGDAVDGPSGSSLRSCSSRGGVAGVGGVVV